MPIWIKIVVTSGIGLFLLGILFDFLGFSFYLWFPCAILGLTGIYILPIYWILRG